MIYARYVILNVIPRMNNHGHNPGYYTELDYHFKEEKIFHLKNWESAPVTPIRVEEEKKKGKREKQYMIFQRFFISSSNPEEKKGRVVRGREKITMLFPFRFHSWNERRFRICIQISNIKTHRNFDTSKSWIVTWDLLSFNKLNRKPVVIFFRKESFSSAFLFFFFHLSIFDFFLLVSGKRSKIHIFSLMIAFGGRWKSVSGTIFNQSKGWERGFFLKDMRNGQYRSGTLVPFHFLLPLPFFWALKQKKKWLIADSVKLIWRSSSFFFINTIMVYDVISPLIKEDFIKKCIAIYEWARVIEKEEKIEDFWLFIAWIFNFFIWVIKSVFFRVVATFTDLIEKMDRSDLSSWKI